MGRYSRRHLRTHYPGGEALYLVPSHPSLDPHGLSQPKIFLFRFRFYWMRQGSPPVNSAYFLTMKGARSRPVLQTREDSLSTSNLLREANSNSLAESLALYFLLLE